MPVPVVNSATTASATRFAAFCYTVTATNTPTSFAATGLPTGLSINTGTGVISGSPTDFAGSYAVSLTATNGDGTSTPLILTITLAATIAPPPRTQGWNENDYLGAILCALRSIAGSATGLGALVVPGSAVGAGVTPVVVPAGMNSISINITAGTVTPSGASTEFSGVLAAGSYTWGGPGAGYTFPEITFTGDGSAAYTVIWTHI